MNSGVYTVHIMNTKDKEDSLILSILESIDNNNNVTQRHMAAELGVALGLANSYLKRCVRKGLIKIHQAPANRYLYYITPKGFSEKSRLTAKYLSYSFEFYRRAGNSFRQLFKYTKQQEWENILFCGISELSEIASLRINEFGLNHVGTYQPDSTLDEFLKKPIMNKIDDLSGIDAYLITSINMPDEIYQQLIKKIEKKRILVPEFLGLNY